MQGCLCRRRPFPAPASRARGRRGSELKSQKRRMRTQQGERPASQQDKHMEQRCLTQDDRPRVRTTIPTKSDEESKTGFEKCAV